MQFNDHLQYYCVLRFKEVVKDYEQFLVKSKNKKVVFDVIVALGNLDCYIHAFSEYICM